VRKLFLWGTEVTDLNSLQGMPLQVSDPARIHIEMSAIKLPGGRVCRAWGRGIVAMPTDQYLDQVATGVRDQNLSGIPCWASGRSPQSQRTQL